eukprot:23502-Alexandrium_andersonii.AAC.1
MRAAARVARDGLQPMGAQGQQICLAAAKLYSAGPRSVSTEAARRQQRRNPPGRERNWVGNEKIGRGPPRSNQNAHRPLHSNTHAKLSGKASKTLGTNTPDG